jgi:hypothetical protein
LIVLRVLYPMATLFLNAPPPGEHKGNLDALVAAVRTIAQILDDDFETGSWLDATLTGAGAEVTAAVRDWLRCVPMAGGEIYLMIERDPHPRPRHRERAETWCFCALHDLFVLLNSGRDGGADAKLQRFVAAAVKYLGWAMRVPTGDSFRLRLRKALSRRSGPVDVLPLIINWHPEPGR